MNQIRVAALSTVASLCASAHAEDRFYSCTFGGESVVNAEARISLPLTGTWIGNWDAVSNPTGTQTRPGVFGGSGNVAIPFTAVVAPNVTAKNTLPTGGFGLILNDRLGLMQVQDFSIDLFGEDSAEIGADITLGFSTFRTFSPNSVYVGISGLTLPLPLGSVSKVAADQVGPAGGMAVPSDDGYTFAIVVPVEFTIIAGALDQSLNQVIPGVFALAGSLDCDGNVLTLTAEASVEESMEIPEVLPALEAVPFGLPTILPPGGTANLLVSGTFSAGTASISVDATLQAIGSSNPTDITGDGIVDGADIGALLRVWGTSSPMADFTGDGTVDGRDLAYMLAYWTI